MSGIGRAYSKLVTCGQTFLNFVLCQKLYHFSFLVVRLDSIHIYSFFAVFCMSSVYKVMMLYVYILVC